MNRKQQAVQKWLDRAYNIDYEINTLLKERERARERISGISAVRFGEKVQTSKNNATENAMVKYLSYDEKIQTRLKRLYEIKSEVLDAVNAVENPTYRQLLTLRYIDFNKWERIAEIMGYSDKWVRTYLHKAALDTVIKSVGGKKNG